MNSSRIYFKIEDIVKSWKEYEILSPLAGNIKYSMVSWMMYETEDISRSKGSVVTLTLSVPTFSHFYWISKLQIPTGKKWGEPDDVCKHNSCIKGKHCIKGKETLLWENESFTMNNDAPVLFCLGDTISIFQHLKQPSFYSWGDTNSIFYEV